MNTFIWYMNVKLSYLRHDWSADGEISYDYERIFFFAAAIFFIYEIIIII